MQKTYKHSWHVLTVTEQVYRMCEVSRSILSGNLSMKLIDANTVKRATSWLLAGEVALMAYFEALEPPVAASKIYFSLIPHSLCVAFRRAKYPDKI